MYCRLEEEKKFDYIIDTDIGGDIDDTLALFVALNSHSKPLAITTTHIEPEEKAKIAKLILAESGNETIPVYAGIGVKRTDHHKIFEEQCPLFPSQFGFPNPKFGEAWYPKQAEAYRRNYHTTFDKIKIESNSASHYIVEKACEYSPERKLTIIALGPLHNIEKALDLKPTIARNITLFSMGGRHPKGYNWLIAPMTTAKVLSKVETYVVSSEFISENQLKITPSELEKITQNLSTQFSKTVMEDWRNWLKGDILSKVDTFLYDPVTVFLALNRNEIQASTPVQLTFPCLQDNFKGIKLTNKGYAAADLERKIIEVTGISESNVRFITQVKSPAFIKQEICSAIRGSLNYRRVIPKTNLSVLRKPTLFCAAGLGVGLLAYRCFNHNHGTIPRPRF